MLKFVITSILILSIPEFKAKNNLHRNLEAEQLGYFEANCTPFNAYGIQHCVVGIPSDQLSVTRQENTEWCWAASISAVFTYYGHSVSQERIVKETFGAIANVPGQPSQIYQALNRTWIDDDGTGFNVTADVFSASLATAIQDLTNDMPLIIGTLGHAMVLTSMEYDHDVYDRFVVRLATVRDPWPYSANRRVLSPQEFFNISFLVRIRVN